MQDTLGVIKRMRPGTRDWYLPEITLPNGLGLGLGLGVRDSVRVRC